MAGTFAMLLSQQPGVLLAGRLIVGVGVGLAMTSGTAWASDLKVGRCGHRRRRADRRIRHRTVRRRVDRWEGDFGVQVSFAVAAALVVVAMAVTFAAARGAAESAPAATRDALTATSSRLSSMRALSWAMPLAPWVFASATLGFITIPARVHTGLAAPIAAGMAALIVNGSSGVIQHHCPLGVPGPARGNYRCGAGRARLWGDRGDAADDDAGDERWVNLVLGCASGLSLREGLIDLEAAAPQHVRGMLTGAFYALTYIGFGLPLLLTNWFGGAQIILAIMSALALTVAISRTLRLRRDSHRQN